jgi:hypothetical protein
MVAHGICVSLLMKKPAAVMCRQSTTLVDIEPVEYSYINMIYKNENLSLPEKNFLKFVHSWLTQE